VVFGRSKVEFRSVCKAILLLLRSKCIVVYGTTTSRIKYSSKFTLTVVALSLSTHFVHIISHIESRLFTSQGLVLLSSVHGFSVLTPVDLSQLFSHGESFGTFTQAPSVIQGFCGNFGQYWLVVAFLVELAMPELDTVIKRASSDWSFGEPRAGGSSSDRECCDRCCSSSEDNRSHSRARSKLNR